MSNSISKRKPFKIYDFPRLIKGDLIKLNPNFHHHHFQRFINHVGIVDWSSYIKQDPRFMRPAEVDVLRGDYKKAKVEMDWKPSTNFNELVKKMVDNDLKLLKK